jgi:hypothetical protein
MFNFKNGEHIKIEHMVYLCSYTDITYDIVWLQFGLAQQRTNIPQIMTAYHDGDMCGDIVDSWTIKYRAEIQHWNNRVLVGDQIDDNPPMHSGQYLDGYVREYTPYLSADPYLNDPRLDVCHHTIPLTTHTIPLPHHHTIHQPQHKWQPQHIMNQISLPVLHSQSMTNIPSNHHQLNITHKPTPTINTPINLSNLNRTNNYQYNKTTQN